MDEDSEKVFEAVRLMKEKEIKLLAIDFDSTFISIHTNGFWTGSVEQLARYVRPFLVKLIDVIIATTTIKVAIVTFSTQTELIARVLKRVLSYPDGIYVQATTREFQMFKKRPPGKEGHIAIVLRNIYRNHGVKIANEEILLLDDDEENVDAAYKSNHFAYLFKEESTLKSLIDYLNSLFIPSNISLTVNHSADPNVSKNAAASKENQSKTSFIVGAPALLPDLKSNQNLNCSTKVLYISNPQIATRPTVVSNFNYYNHSDPRLDKTSRIDDGIFFRNTASAGSASSIASSSAFHEKNFTNYQQPSAVVYLPVYRKNF